MKKTMSPCLNLARKLGNLLCHHRALTMKTWTRRKRREEMSLTRKSHGVGWLRMMSSPQSQVGLGWGEIIKCIDPSSEARIWKCNHCKSKWSGWNHTKALGHAIGGGRTLGAARMCLLNGGSCTWVLSKERA